MALQRSLTSFSGLVAVAQSAAHLSVLALVELEPEQCRASLQLVCLHQLFPFSLPSSFSAHTCIIPLGFKTLIYPGFIGDFFVVVAFKL